MDELRAELVAAWMGKAESDLIAAKRLGEPGDEDELPLFDLGAFHCHQAAEKSLKAYLLQHSKRLRKVHDLDELLSEAASIDPAFNELRERADALSSFAVEVRYPGDAAELDAEDFALAFAVADGIHRFVRDRL